MKRIALMLTVAAATLAAMVWVATRLGSRQVFAQQTAEQRGYNIGDAVNEFQLRSVSGNMVSLKDYAAGKGLILVFTSNHCPFSKAYESRLIALNSQFAPQGFPVVAINANDASAYEEDSFDNMKARAQSAGFTFPYLADASQQVARAFGATRTPHAFVLQKQADRFTVQYIGAIDDNSQDPAGVSRRYVEEAVTNLLQGKPVMLNVSRPVGCAIQWKE